jgi:hypothetical protein
MNVTSQTQDHVAEAEYIRLPRPNARCPVSALSRTTLTELIAAGKIKAAKVRKRNAQRGIVLINRASLLEYLHGLESEQSHAE